MQHPSAIPEETRYGWVMVAVTPLFMALGAGSLSSISVFLRPITADLGWARGDTSFAYLAGTMALGLGGILMGFLADRSSIRAVAVAGTISLGAMLVLLSRQRSLWELYLFYSLLGGLGVGAFYAPLLANVGNWFERNKGLALGVTTAAVALGQGGVIYGSRFLITALGWQGAYLALGLTAWGVLLPLCIFVRRPPAPASQRSDTAMRPAPEVEGNQTIAPALAVGWISSAVVFCCIVMATALVHGVALAQDLGIAPQSAAGVVSLMWLSGLVGRIIFGRLADHAGGPGAYLLASAIQTSLVFWFTRIETLAGLYSLAIVFGLGFSGVMTCFTVCVRELVPLRIRSTAMGVVFFFGWLGMGLGGWQGGYFYDLTGSYTLSFANAALAGVVNLVVVGSLWLYLRQREARPAAAPTPA